ncbi:polysaccharide pyruvyl transferase family protein [Hirschia litorea]|uniref:Polysaccharide pyruvyl transferase family protein n=1 Tax=Hirschia litorea TaxID=1199156 RepID=A0ABW2IP36_9PROT
MRIGILTYHFSENFGALMQAYGLRQWLVEQGHDADFINYHPRYVEEGGSFVNIYSPKQFKANLKIAFLIYSRIRKSLVGNKKQLKLFAEFHRDVLGVTGSRLETLKELENYLLNPIHKFDAIICGSDQIWNPSDQRGLDPAYFAAISDSDIGKRIMYAPSFGRASLDPIYNETVATYVNSIDGLSVREESGVKILKDITGRDADCVPDPAILLGDFSSLIKVAEPVRSDHVFCYALRSGGGITQAANIVANELKTEVVSPYNVHRRWKEIGSTVYPSPAGWVSLINSSSFVVTNSFHGTVLSILLQKPFIVVGLPGAKGKLNERARDLLEKLGLADRLIAAEDYDQAKVLVKKQINWESVSVKLADMQKVGRNYLKNQLDF